MFGKILERMLRATRTGGFEVVWPNGRRVHYGPIDPAKSRELFIQRDDFMEDPPANYHRLAPGRVIIDASDGEPRRYRWDGKRAVEFPEPDPEEERLAEAAPGPRPTAGGASLISSPASTRRCVTRRASARPASRGRSGCSMKSRWT
jgi:hypothetical protein